MAAKAKTKVKLIVEFADGSTRVGCLPYAAAFAGARGIAADTHCGVTLIGEFGTATFNPRGGGSVLWNEKSTCPGEKTEFGERTTVSI